MYPPLLQNYSTTLPFLCLFTGIVFSCQSMCVRVVALLQIMALVLDCAVLQKSLKSKELFTLSSYTVLHQLFDFFCLNS